MFNKILIANRGEIACRIIKTAQRMGIRTVAVYSAADARARHVRMADEAIAIGAAPARESYLLAERVLDACIASGAQAVHPGYGFLSENAAFAAACAARGVVFIGPPVAAIQAMGSKSEAKKLMEKAGVPLTPGYHGDNQAADFLKAQADAIGYPVLIKAAAGGGGKGMRAVDCGEEFHAALASCQREAQASFSDAQVLIEKYLQRPRHIEMQIFGDSQGHYVHLFERDCSVQRRHQKVLEEAPAPGLDEGRRAAMGEAALAAARAVGYVGAGTVEFIVNPDGSFYFMEMNTRLQVEHPVSEMITGLDLVEWQLRVAAGEPLPLTQEQIVRRGHAIEARIYAEDADKGFLPSTGTLTTLASARESLHVRIDSGVEPGDEISVHYDPMIAKLIVHDDTRQAALNRMQRALADYRIVGVTSNIDFLSRLVACPAFAGADLDTGLIERERDYLFPAAQTLTPEVWQLAALAEVLRDAQHARQEALGSDDPHSPWHRRDGWRAALPGERRIVLRHDGEEMTLTVRYLGADEFSLDAGTGVGALCASGRLDADGTLRANLGGRRLGATVIAAGERRHVFVDGKSHVLAAIDPLFHAAAGGGNEGGLCAPMPGKIVALLAALGAPLEKGAPLLILEAMKMEHTLTAPAAGCVRRFHFAVGEQVGDGVDLLEFERLASPPPS